MRRASEGEDNIVKIRSYHAMGNFLTFIFKFDQIYHEQEDETVRTKIKQMIGSLNQPGYQDIEVVIEQFIEIVERYNVSEKIVVEFQKFSEQYLTHDSYLRAADQHMRSSFSKQTSHLTMSMKTFENLGKTAGLVNQTSKQSIPDLTMRITSVLRNNTNNKAKMMNILGMNRQSVRGSIRVTKNNIRNTKIPTGFAAMQLHNANLGNEDRPASKISFRKSLSMGRRSSDMEELYDVEDVDIEDVNNEDHRDRVNHIVKKKSQKTDSRHSSKSQSQKEIYSKEEQNITLEDDLD